MCIQFADINTVSGYPALVLRPSGQADTSPVSKILSNGTV